MNITYRRNMNHSYMILSGEDMPDAQSYVLHMVTENEIPCFLPCHLEWMDGQALFYYDVTSRQSIKTLLELRKVDRPFLELLFSCLKQALDSLQNYLLPENGLLMDPETIFINANRTEFSFCYFPGQENTFAEGMQTLSETLLPRLDHGDQQAVVMGYAFYQQCGRGEADAAGFQEILDEIQPRSVEDGDQINSVDLQESMKMDNAEDPDGMMEAFFPEEQEPEEKKKKGFWSRLRERKAEKEAQKSSEGTGKKMRKSGSKEEWEKSKSGEHGDWDKLPYGDAENKKNKKKRREKHKEQEKERNKEKEQEKLLRKRQKEDPEDFNIQDELAPYMYEAEKNTWQVQEGQKERYGEIDEMEETMFLGRESSASYNQKTIRARLITEEKEYSLVEDHYVIGKNSQASDIVFSSPAVSRVHAILQWRDNTYSISDLNSKNGTKVGDHWLQGEEEILLQDGDQIRIADVKVRYETDD